MYKDISEKYLQLQGWMITKLELSGNELLTFGLIYGFTQDDVSVYYGSLNYLQTWLNVSRPTAIKALKGLVKKNYLLKSEYLDDNKVKKCTYKANAELIKNALQGSKETLPGSKETLPGGSKETLPYNTNIDNKERDKKKNAHFFKKNKEKVSSENTSRADVNRAGRKKASPGKTSTHQNKDNLKAFDFIQQQRPNDFKKDFQDQYSHRIKDKDKFVKSFNNQIIIEGLPFDPDRLLARLDNYAMNWVKNDNRYNQQNQSFNNRTSNIPILSHAK